VRRGLVGVVVVLVVLAASVLGPEPVVVVMAVVGLARVRAARSAAAARRRAVERAVPDLVDLFVIAAAAGHTVPGCLTMVGPRAPLPVRPVLTRAGTALARGRTLADVLDDLGPQLGVLGPTLTGVLASSAATGAPLGAALADVAALARDRRRREAENEVRRLPVTMLFPLVCCVLPAFVLLAVVPLLAAALASLEV
jgi:Flp pilus assembly protein TadB